MSRAIVQLTIFVKFVFFFVFSLFISLSLDSNSDASMEIATSTSNPLRRFLLSFSWRRNFEILFSDLPNDCVNDVIEIAGLRVICLLWISMVHVCTVLYYISGKIHITIKQNQKHSKSNDQFNQFFVLFTEQIFGFFFSFSFRQQNV